MAGRSHFPHMPPIDTVLMNGAGNAACRSQPKALFEEFGVLVGGHFAASYGELAVANAAQTGHVTAYRDVVRRVSEYELNALLAKQDIVSVGLQCIAAEKSMVAQIPTVAVPADSF